MPHYSNDSRQFGAQISADLRAEAKRVRRFAEEITDTAERSRQQGRADGMLWAADFIDNKTTT